MGRRHIKFRGRHFSVKSVAALAAGVFSLIAFLVMVIISGLNEGRVWMAMGITGIVSFFISLAGFIVSVLSVREHDIYYAIPVAGMTVNGISVLVYVLIYIMGLV